MERSFTPPLNQVHIAGRIATLLRISWERNWPLTLVSLAMLPILLASLLGVIIDPRIIGGVPAWIKPAKFAISITIYAFTFIWMLGFLEGPKLRRWANRAATITAIAFVVEMLIVTLQVIRGTTSHFNVSTPFDSVMLGTMAGFIMLLWWMGLILAVGLLVQRIPNPAFALALRTGIVIALIGAGLGALMTMPTSDQRAEIASGVVPRIIGAHAVGVPDSAPGLPLVGWSTTGGDLRIGHFVGLHAMQIIPFAGWLLSRRRQLRQNQQVGLVAIFSTAYLGSVAIFTWQALRGQSIIAPDSLTLGAFAGLALVSALAAMVIFQMKAART